LIFPGVTPVRSGANERNGRVHDGWMVCRGVNQQASPVALPQTNQREIMWSEMVETGWQGIYIAARHVEFHFIERAGASRVPEIDLTARMAPALCDACRVMQERCQCSQVQSVFCSGVCRLRSDGRKRGCFRVR